MCTSVTARLPGKARTASSGVLEHFAGLWRRAPKRRGKATLSLCLMGAALCVPSFPLDHQDLVRNGRVASALPAPAGTCSDFGGSAPVVGSVSLRWQQGGVETSWRFATPLTISRGELLTWSVYLYPSRQDAATSEGGLLLAIGNRGAGWDTNRWLLAEISNSDGAVVLAPRISHLGTSQLSAYFPSVPLAGPHFYWFADETVSATAPVSTVALEIGSNACPDGILPEVFGLPVPEKLLFYTS